MCADRRQDYPHSSVPFTEEVNGQAHFNARRFWEGVLVAVVAAVVAAGASTWATTKVLSHELQRQKKDIEELKRDIRDLRRDLYRPHPWSEAADMLISELATELKDSLHDAGDVFDVGDFKRHIRIALQAMALAKRPRTVMAPLSLAADQASYPAPADLAAVVRLEWGNAASRQPWRHDHPGPAPLASLVETSAGREIRLSPPPTLRQVRALHGRCELVYQALHQLEPTDEEGSDYEITSLAEADRPLVLLRAQAEACKELAMRGSTKPVDLRGGGMGQARNMTPRALYEALLTEWRDAP